MSGKWSAHQAATGHMYYYNHETGVSQWEPPEDFDAGQGVSSDGASGAAMPVTGHPGVPPGAVHDSPQSFVPGTGPSVMGGGGGVPAGMVPGGAGGPYVYGGGAYESGAASSDVTGVAQWYGGGVGGVAAPVAAPVGGSGGVEFASGFAGGPGPPIQRYPGRTSGGDGCDLFIFHIPSSMTNLALYHLFSPFGEVLSCRIVVDRETGRSRGFGFVSYDSQESAARAIENNHGLQVGRKRLSVSIKREKGKGGPGTDSPAPKQAPGPWHHLAAAYGEHAASAAAQFYGALGISETAPATTTDAKPTSSSSSSPLLEGAGPNISSGGGGGGISSGGGGISSGGDAAKPSSTSSSSSLTETPQKSSSPPPSSSSAPSVSSHATLLSTLLTSEALEAIITALTLPETQKRANEHIAAIVTLGITAASKRRQNQASADPTSTLPPSGPPSSVPDRVSSAPAGTASLLGKGKE